MKSIANFHIHTVHSDGGRTVEQVVKELKEQGVKYFAITDHDTIDGVEEAMRLAEEYGLHCVSGVEISGVFSENFLRADVKGLDETCVGHIVALDFDIPKMRKLLYGYQLDKELGIIRLTYALLDHGYAISKENIFNGGLDGRTDVAKELVRTGYATDVTDAFERILNKDYKFYADIYPPINNILHDIKDCGGLCVLAHPYSYTRGGKKTMSKKQFEEYISNFKRADAVEVYYQKYDAERIASINEIAEKYGMMKSIATDYHNSPVDLVKYPEYAARLKKETLCFDVDGVTVDESILAVLEGRKDKRDRAFVLERTRVKNMSCFVGAHLQGMTLEFNDIITETLDDGRCDQSEETIKIKNLEVIKFLNAIGCSVYDDDEKIGSALKKAFDEEPSHTDKVYNMLRAHGVTNINHFVSRSDD